MKKFSNAIPKPWIGIYVLWFAVHFALLLLLDKTFTYKKEFWPFEPSSFYAPFLLVNSYDYTEFLFYLVLPILLLIGIYLLKPKSSKQP